MNLLVISHLFPNAVTPLLGIFVEKQLTRLAQHPVKMTVLVPVPWANALLARLSHKWRQYYSIESRRDYGSFAVEYVRFLRLPGRWFRPLSGTTCTLALRRHLHAQHKHARFDAILANTVIPDGEAAVRLGKELGIPAFCYAVGEDLNVYPFENDRMYRRTRFVLDNLHTLLTTGSDLARIAKSIAPGVNTLTLFRGCDVRLFSPNAGARKTGRQRFSFAEQDTVLTYLGFLRADKGLRELMTAFSNLADKHPHLRLLVIGTGPLQPEFVQWIEKNRLQQRVTLAGEVPHRETAELLNASDIFVFPSYHEGLPNAVVEAAACGLPVLGTDIPGIRDVLGPDYASRLIPPRDAGALTAALEAMITNTQERRRLGEIARQRATQLFDSDKNSETLYRYLQSGLRS